MDHTFWANTYSRSLASGVIVFGFWFLMYATDGMILRIMDGPPQPADWPIGLKAGAHMALLGFQLYVVYSMFYRPIRDSLKRVMLDRQRKGKYPIKTLPEVLNELGEWIHKLQIEKRR
jgi:hypothetical protein